MRIGLTHCLRKVIEVLAVVSSVAICSAVLAQASSVLSDVNFEALSNSLRSSAGLPR